MKPEEFKREVDRLVKTYGPKAYPQERADLLWHEFRSVEAQVFTAAVSRLIGESAHAPLVPRIREVIAEMRERGWQGQKRVHAEDAKRAYSDVYGGANVSFQDYVVRVVDNRKTRADEFAALIKVWKLEKIEEIYNRRKAQIQEMQSMPPAEVRGGESA